MFPLSCLYRRALVPLPTVHRNWGRWTFSIFIFIKIFGLVCFCQKLPRFARNVLLQISATDRARVGAKMVEKKQIYYPLIDLFKVEMQAGESLLKCCDNYCVGGWGGLEFRVWSIFTSTIPWNDFVFIFFPNMKSSEFSARAWLTNVVLSRLMTKIIAFQFFALPATTART